MEYLYELNEGARLAPFGQELNGESYAICKADMLVKGQDVSHIRLGNTISDDQLGGNSSVSTIILSGITKDWTTKSFHLSSLHRVKERFGVAKGWEGCCATTTGMRLEK